MISINKYTDPLNESNCYVIEKEGSCVVVDPNEKKPLVDWIKARGLKPDYILLTHEHCDHMAGLDYMRDEWPEAVCVLSEKCNEGIQSTKYNMTSMMEVYLTFSGKPGVSYPPFVCRPADKVYSGDEWAIDWNGLCIRTISLPGHTPGSCGMFFGDDIFFSGDYLIPQQETVLRLPGGSEEDYIKYTLPFLNSLKPGTHIYPGHGEPYEFRIPV